MEKGRLALGFAVKVSAVESCSECSTKLSTVHMGTDGKAYCTKCAKDKGIKEIAIFDIGIKTVDSYNR